MCGQQEAWCPSQPIHVSFLTQDGQSSAYVAKTGGYAGPGTDAAMIFFLSSRWLCPLDAETKGFCVLDKLYLEEKALRQHVDGG